MKLLKDISYSLTSNVMNMLASALVVMIVPKVVGVTQYGYWQIFLFYTGYVGLFHFGWADGLFLRRGGERTENLNAQAITGELILFLVFQIIVSVFVITAAMFVSNHYRYITIAVSLAIVVMNLKTWITMLLQATGQFKSAAINVLTQTTIYFILILLLVLLRVRWFETYVAAFLIAQTATSISGIVQLRPLLSKVDYSNVMDSLSEAKQNIHVGSQLMVANFSALLILGVARLGIQKNWSVEIFGQVSLMLSVANLIMLFINAVSVVLFPTIRRSTVNISNLYHRVRTLLMPLLYYVMLLYYPIVLILKIWLPEYKQALPYFSVLMPMMFYQGKFEILSNTFMKSLRLERKLLIINLSSLILSAILTGIFSIVFHLLSGVVISMAIVLAFRSVLSEIIIGRYIEGIKFGQSIFETIVIAIFISMNWNLPIGMSFVFYLLFLGAYSALKFNDVRYALKKI